MQKRLFIAVPVPPQVKERIVEAQAELEKLIPNMHWIGAPLLHVTLVFLGETPSKKIDLVKEILTTTSGNTTNFELRLQGLGAFKADTEATVLFFHVAEPISQPFTALQHRLQKSLITQGFRIKAKRWVPHVTIGRFKQETDVREAINQIIFDDVFWSCREVILIESRIGPGGAQYFVRHTVPLL